jgi:hypothetical protein
MSTIPLSMREGHGQTLSGGDAPPAAMHSGDDSKLDALIDSVTETITTRESPEGDRDEVLLDASADGDDSDSWRAFKAKLDDPEAARDRGPGSELDRTLKVAVDRRASQEAESADFHQSREWRDVLDRRYGGRYGIGEVLDAFADWHEAFKTDPRRAFDALASAYLDQPAYVLPAAEHRGHAESPAKAEDTSAAQTLDGVLAAAIDRHHGKSDGEQPVFAASARHRTALKEMFPGMSYAEACRRVVTLDGDLHRDPIGTAARLAATYGMPVTSAQHALAEQRNVQMGETQQMIAAAAELTPELAEMEDELVTVLGRPEFVHGPDVQDNLFRARHVVQLARQERQRRRDQRGAARAAAPSNLDRLIAQAMRGTAA